MTRAGIARRDFRAELRDVACWSAGTQAIFDREGEALEDCVLQNREELIALCEVMERLEVRSYLEIGAWTGALARCLARLFALEPLGVCDDGWAERRGFELRLPDHARLFRGDSGSAGFERWRAALGPIDLVLIDANHSYQAVSRDFEINLRHPHRLLVFHDITGANRFTTGVGRFWRELVWGHKLEILRPHAELGLDHSVMGLGLWSEAPFPQDLMETLASHPATGSPRLR